MNRYNVLYRLDGFVLKVIAVYSCSSEVAFVLDNRGTQYESRSWYFRLRHERIHTSRMLSPLPLLSLRRDQSQKRKKQNKKNKIGRERKCHTRANHYNYMLCFATNKQNAVKSNDVTTVAIFGDVTSRVRP